MNNILPRSFSATDGTVESKVRLTWQAPTNGDPKKYIIYRNGELIAEPGSAATLYIDSDVIPGKEYVYDITAVYNSACYACPNNGAETFRVTAKGASKPNGQISGSVITLETGTGVPGVTIKAKAVIEGSTLTFETQTNTKGEFVLSQLPFGTEAEYTLTASYLDHKFLVAQQKVVLNEFTTKKIVPSFRDMNANIIRGIVRRMGTHCGMDSIRVVLKAKKVSGGQEVNSVKTDASGAFSFNVNPFDELLTEYELYADSLTVRVMGDKADTILHRFTPRTLKITKSEAATGLVERDLVDMFSYPAKLVVGTVCGALEDAQFYIRIFSTDKCFDTTLLTNASGIANLDLPPLSYVMTVKDINRVDASLKPIVDYLKVRPIRLDLAALHKRYKNHPDSIAPFLNLNFTYHKTPNIAVSDFGTRQCSDLSKPIVINQNMAYTVSVDVTERFSGFDCPVNEGFLLIKSPGFKNPSTDTVFYDAASGAFESYSFIGGRPNLVSPHLYGMFIEYHTEKDGFLGQLIQPILVQGNAEIPGADIFVNPVDDESNVVQIPMFVLHDPPGDGSYSYVEKGTKLTKKLEWELGGALGASVFGEAELAGGGVLIGFEGSVGAGVELGGGEGFEISTELTEEISTLKKSAESTNLLGILSGRPADVIVGAGLALKYGLVQSVNLVDGCSVQKVTKIGLTANEVKTKWVYTIAHIEKLIAEYDQKIADIANGKLEIRNASDELIGSDYFSTIRYNWTQIVDYRDRTTLPHYKLCTDENELKYYQYDGFTHLNNHPHDLKAREEARDRFCAVAYDEALDRIKPDFEWTTATLKDFNDAYGYDDIPTGIESGELTAAGINNYVNDNYDNRFARPYAENITFGGGTSYERIVVTAKG
ncbi:MAG: hypothetical protein HC842_00380 [Cytophagales bacterium]|nr:hypothetical protein [Cytophagales bacterium]